MRAQIPFADSERSHQVCVGRRRSVGARSRVATRINSIYNYVERLVSCGSSFGFSVKIESRPVLFGNIFVVFLLPNSCHLVLAELASHCVYFFRALDTYQLIQHIEYCIHQKLVFLID